ncbi:hypothetical protein L6E12_21000 [Actinokineospora sp. PR83]|uniref:hypothetical protein n=1 Tax=Actinokineospora sp. PR83 TaxID=2884908 RepID=UPI001F18342A|nr:hypothetical protein [Actinokineospora sp. PR83]MCG8918265.1 hypothetical protein [Actinokineospora sp. PR83]
MTAAAQRRAEARQWLPPLDQVLVEPVGHGGLAPVGEDPTAAVYAAGHVFADELGKVDSTLLRSGVRWCRLRWMHRSVRVRLAREVLAREMPANTRTCWEGGRVWLDEVGVRVDGQRWQRRRKDTWTAVAVLLAESVRPGLRPLTEISHKALAVAVGVSERYVTDIMGWFCEQGLLGKLLTGTQFPRLETPEGETAAERAGRLARRRAAEAARRARRTLALAQARAELDALREGKPVPAADLDPYREFRAVQDGADEGPDLIALASVYELRLPVPPPPAPAPRPENVVSLDEARRARRPSPVEGCPQCDDEEHNPPLSSANTQKFYPTDSGRVTALSPEHRGDVDERRASRGSEKKGSGQVGGSKSQVTRRSVAQRTAQALLVGPVEGWCEQDVTLPQRLRRGVKPSWLAGKVRPLTAAGWTPLEIAWHLLTRGGRYATLPVGITNAPGWITASLRAADPQVRPTVKWAADDLDREGLAHAAHRAEQIARHAGARREHEERRERERGRAKRAAIEACGMCDEHGWLDIPDVADAVRCNHDPTTGGW